MWPMTIRNAKQILRIDALRYGILHVREVCQVWELHLLLCVKAHAALTKVI